MPVINVQRTEVLRTGGQPDKPWTLYEVHATDENGQPFDRPVRSFDALPVGTVQAAEIKPYTNKRTGEASYHVVLPKTVRPARGARNTGERTSGALEMRVVTLERQVEELNRKYGALVRALTRDEQPES